MCTLRSYVLKTAHFLPLLFVWVVCGAEPKKNGGLVFVCSISLKRKHNLRMLVLSCECFLYLYDSLEISSILLSKTECRPLRYTKSMYNVYVRMS